MPVKLFLKPALHAEQSVATVHVAQFARHAVHVFVVVPVKI